MFKDEEEKKGDDNIPKNGKWILDSISNVVKHIKIVTEGEIPDEMFTIDNPTLYQLIKGNLKWYTTEYPTLNLDIAELENAKFRLINTCNTMSKSYVRFRHDILRSLGLELKLRCCAPIGYNIAKYEEMTGKDFNYVEYITDSKYADIIKSDKYSDPDSPTNYNKYDDNDRDMTYAKLSKNDKLAKDIAMGINKSYEIIEMDEMSITVKHINAN